MDIRASTTDESTGQTTSYVLGGLSLFLIVINFLIVAILCKFAKDGYDALFSTPLTKLMLKICGVIQIVFQKILFLPLIMILISVVICSKDTSITKPNNPQSVS